MSVRVPVGVGHTYLDEESPPMPTTTCRIVIKKAALKFTRHVVLL